MSIAWNPRCNEGAWGWGGMQLFLLDMKIYEDMNDSSRYTTCEYVTESLFFCSALQTWRFDAGFCVSQGKRVGSRDFVWLSRDQGWLWCIHRSKSQFMFQTFLNHPSSIPACLMSMWMRCKALSLSLFMYFESQHIPVWKMIYACMHILQGV